MQPNSSQSAVVLLTLSIAFGLQAAGLVTVAAKAGATK
nr:MAG TPA: hypothetical protein [Caudoviricetes sp.]